MLILEWSREEDEKKIEKSHKIIQKWKMPAGCIFYHPRHSHNMTGKTGRFCVCNKKQSNLVLFGNETQKKM